MWRVSGPSKKIRQSILDLNLEIDLITPSESHGIKKLNLAGSYRLASLPLISWPQPFCDNSASFLQGALFLNAHLNGISPELPILPMLYLNIVNVKKCFHLPERNHRRKDRLKQFIIRSLSIHNCGSLSLSFGRNLVEIPNLCQDRGPEICPHLAQCLF